jgi:PAS domain-containing protein
MTNTTPQDAALLLRSAMAHIPFGIALFDRSYRLVLANQAFRDLLELPEVQAPLGIAMSEIVQLLGERGEYPGQVGRDLSRQRLHAVYEGTGYTIERSRPNGRWIEARHIPLDDGGSAQIYTDITDRIERRWRSEGALLDLKTRVRQLEEQLARLTPPGKTK